MVKPRISYIERASLPNIPTLNVGIVRKRQGRGFRNWNNKSELTGYIDGLKPYPESDTYMYVRCRCGREYTYADSAGIPSSNLVCPCGKDIIIYGN